MEPVSQWQYLVEYLRSYGFGPAGIALIVMVGWSLVRSARRESTERERDAAALEREHNAQKRQDAFNARVDNELKRMNERLERSEQDREVIHKALEKSENERHKIETANLILDRYKAVCEDACPLAAEIHKLRLPKWTPNNPST